MTSAARPELANTRHSTKKQRSKAKLATFAAVAIVTGGAFTAIEASSSFAAENLPAGSKVTGHGTGATEEEATNNAFNDAARQCASSAISGLAEAGSENASQKPDKTWEATFDDMCVDPGPNG